MDEDDLLTEKVGSGEATTEGAAAGAPGLWTASRALGDARAEAGAGAGFSWPPPRLGLLLTELRLLDAVVLPLVGAVVSRCSAISVTGNFIGTWRGGNV